jgi:PIN domain nuclease of toxin-antitoxin system
VVSRSLLLDTHAILWMFGGEALSGPATAAIDEVWTSGGALLVSPISTWEIGMLVRKGRIALPIAPMRWVKAMLEAPGVQLAEMSPEVLVDASFLPMCPLRDPADQILVATARATGSALITRDGPILSYAEAGHVQAVAC